MNVNRLMLFFLFWSSGLWAQTCSDEWDIVNPKISLEPIRRWGIEAKMRYFEAGFSVF